MILAAGRGVRMGALTDQRPKPLLKVAGTTLLDRQLDLLSAAGCDTVVVNVSYRAEMIKDALRARRPSAPTVLLSEEAVALETAGGIVQALPLLGTEPFLLLNADVVADFDPAALALTATQLGCLMLVPNPDHNPGGDFGIDDQGRASLDAPLYTYSGLALLHPDLFAGLAPGSRPLRPVLEVALGAGRLAAQLHRGHWLDVGTPERLALAESVLSPGAGDGDA